MDEPASPRSRPLSREERLAAKLRENLRRRKSQSRVLEQRDEEAPGRPVDSPDNATLPKGGASR